MSDYNLTSLNIALRAFFNNITFMSTEEAFHYYMAFAHIVVTNPTVAWEDIPDYTPWKDYLNIEPKVLFNRIENLYTDIQQSFHLENPTVVVVDAGDMSMSLGIEAVQKIEELHPFGLYEFASDGEKHFSKDGDDLCYTISNICYDLLATHNLLSNNTPLKELTHDL